MDKIIDIISKELDIRPNQVESTIKLIDDGKIEEYVIKHSD